MNWRILATTVLIATLFAFACGDDDDGDDGNGDTTPEATEPAENGDEPEPTEPEEPANGDTDGGGSATLTVGDETYSFSNYECAFGEDETGNTDVEFSSQAFGESATGAQTQLTVDITLGIHAVNLDDIDNFEDPSVSWSAESGITGDFEIQIDGNEISAEANFLDGTTDDIETTPGTFSGTCP